MTDRVEVLAALDAVRDPELDEPVTELGFVSSCTVSDDGEVQVRLRLPTFFCAPNFAFLMVADAYDAVAAVDGVHRTEVVLDDHFASDAINSGIAARSGFAESFGSLADGELDELRTDFVRKAVLAGTDRVCRPLLAEGRTMDDLAELTLGDLPPSPDLTRLRARRAELGLPASDDFGVARGCDNRGGGRRTGAAAAPAKGPADPGQHGGERQRVPRHAVPPLRNPRRGPVGGDPMKAVRLHAYNEKPTIDEVEEPTVKGPLDVVVKVGGAGVCRTDLHIILGQWDEAMNPSLPYTIGHENAGWVHEVGSAVTNVAVGDTVILHPTPTCGLCRACRAGQDMHCTESIFPGLDGTDGGMAEYLLTSARACVKLDPSTQPKDVAALADAGITAYHAVRKALPLLYPGTTAVVTGAGGLGHIGIQCLAALTATNIIVVDRNAAALELAGELGATADGRSPTASTSTPSRTSPTVRVPTWSSTSWPRRARRTRASR